MAVPTIEETWTYYRDSYGGNLPEDEFKQLATSVLMRLDELTFSRDVPEDMQTRYMQAFSELVDFKNQTGSTGLQGGIVEAETIDGYSVKYRTNAYSQQRSDEVQIAGKYLTYPKNLMYCGTERKCKLTTT